MAYRDALGQLSDRELWEEILDAEDLPVPRPMRPHRPWPEHLRHRARRAREDAAKAFKYSDTQPREPAGSPEGGRFASTNHDVWAATLTKPQRDALTSYASSGYHHTNAYLRAGAVGVAEDFARSSGLPVREKPALVAAAKKTTAEIDAAFASAPPTTADATVYRGMVLGDVPIAVGSTFTDKGFVSTSEHRAVADRFVDYKRDEVKESSLAVAAIHVPAGSRVIPFLSVWRAAVGNNVLNLAEDEREVLIGRGRTFRVTGIKTDAIGRRQIAVDLVK